VTTSSANVALAVTPASAIQFQSVTMTATVTAATGGVPTGTVSFLNGTTVLSTGTLNANGVATFTTTSLAIANYSVVASYPGDTNFTPANSTAVALTVAPDPPDFTMAGMTLTLGAVQDGVAQTTLTVTPSNTLVGNVTFSCTGLPANAACTLGTDVPATTLLTLWTNVSPGLNAKLKGRRGFWLAMLLPIGLLALTRQRLTRLLGLICVLGAIEFGINGCGTGTAATPGITPAGVSSVTVMATGPNGQSHTLAFTFTVLAN
jgi:hypothetical protein